MIAPHSALVVGLIYLVVPMLGLATFLRLRRITAPYADALSLDLRLFALFVVYGGWVLVLLTGLFWKWSGAASLGVGFLLFGAPLVLLAIGIASFPHRRETPLHRLVFWAAAFYIPLVLVGAAVAAQCCGGRP